MRLDRVAILIKRASLKFDRISNAVLGKFDLTTGQYKVLMYLLAESDNGVRTADLDRYHSMSHQTTIGILRNLEKKGWISYKDNPNDARSRFIVPTDKAYAEQDKLLAAGDELEEQLTQKLTEDERLELVRLLRKLMDLEPDT